MMHDLQHEVQTGNRTLATLNMRTKFKPRKKTFHKKYKTGQKIKKISKKKNYKDASGNLMN